MSYQVLARRWRPQTFDDVVGQEAVVKTLRRALETERVAHAFLFCGSRGIGKTTLARIMAKALCCETGVTASPCGTCVHCKEITAGNAVDIVEIDGASNNSVDNVRDLRETARFQPQSCRFKVFIIDEVHMLSTAAFNALLKTLEEPPPHVKFLFATTEPHKIPVTILSRCQRYDFKRISSEQIVARLRFVLGEEGLSIDDAGLAVIARAAEGGMRDALSLTDQVLSFGGDGASAELVSEALGLIDRRVIVRAVGAILERDAKAAMDEVERCFAQGYDLRQFAEAVCAELRHLNVAKACGSVRGFADLADDDLDDIDARAKRADPKDLMRLFSAALDGLDRMGDTENEKLCVELTVLRLCERPPVSDAVAVSEALVRLDAIARGKPVPPLSSLPSGGGAGGGGAGGGSGAGGGGRAQQIVQETLTSRANGSASAHAEPAPPLQEREETPATRADTVSMRPSEMMEADAAPAPGPAPAQADAGPSPASSSSPPRASEEGASVTSGDGEAIEEDEGEQLEEDLGLDLEDVDETWAAFVVEVERRTRSFLGGALTHGLFVGVDDASSGPRVKVAFAQPHHAERVAAALTREELVGPLAIFGEGAFLEIVDVPAKPGTSVFAARRVAREKIQVALEEHARAHPTVKKALELFGGEIRAVRS